MLSLLENLRGQAFSEYVSTCFQVSDIFSLTKNGWSTANQSNEAALILKLLAPYHLRTLHTNRWFCYRVPAEHDIEIYTFRSTQEAKKILLSNYDSIFYDDHVWKKPEDLCFFKEQKLFSGSVAHERICFVYDDTIQLPGRWEAVPSNLVEQIQIPIWL